MAARVERGADVQVGGAVDVIKEVLNRVGRRRGIGRRGGAVADRDGLGRSVMAEMSVVAVRPATEPVTDAVLEAL